jgi:hypothetical protein
MGCNKAQVSLNVQKYIFMLSVRYSCMSLTSIGMFVGTSEIKFLGLMYECKKNAVENLIGAPKGWERAQRA